jgi:tryptophanyl-tRNA synthetase
MSDINEQVKKSKGDSRAVATEEDLNPLLPDGTRKRILTGDRTTGKLHLGHYVGSLKNRVRLQDSYDTFILMADIQALTTHHDKPEILQESVREVALDYLAVGLDPEKVTIVIQSAVPAIAELTCLYGLFTPMSLILDNPTTKAEAQQYGFGATEDSVDVVLNADDKQLYEELANKLHSEFPEISGDLAISDLVVIVSGLKNSGDVSLVHDLEGHGYADNAPAAVLHSARALRVVREQLIASKRTAGMRQMNYGFLGYPVSQAADITFVNAHLVPVGVDQVPHIELTRQIVKRFNRQYSKKKSTLVMPQALVGGGGVLKALDGSAKMSKSLGNAIYLSDDGTTIWNLLKKAVTDPQRVRRDDPGRPEVCNVFAYHQVFNEDTEPVIAAARTGCPSVAETAHLCRTAGIGCGDCKKNLATKLEALLDPIRTRRANWAKRPDDVMDILKTGTARGNAEGNRTVELVKEKMYLKYWD